MVPFFPYTVYMESKVQAWQLLSRYDIIGLLSYFSLVLRYNFAAVDKAYAARFVMIVCVCGSQCCYGCPLLLHDSWRPLYFVNVLLYFFIQSTFSDVCS